MRAQASRLGAAGKKLDRDQRFAAAAAVALLATMLLPWYEKSVVVAGSRTFATDTISAFGAVSFVEAAIFLVAAGVVMLVLTRAEGGRYHLPGGDGTVIFAAGVWACALIFYRVFDRPDVSGDGGTVGIQWGFFVAFVAAGALAFAGRQMRVAARPEPPVRTPRPGRAQTPQAPDWSDESTESVPVSRARTEVVPTGDTGTKVVRAADASTEVVPATDARTGVVRAAHARTEVVPATDARTGVVRAAHARTEVVPATDARTGVRRAADARTEVVPATEARTGVRRATDARTEVVPATDARTGVRRATDEDAAAKADPAADEDLAAAAPEPRPPAPLPPGSRPPRDRAVRRADAEQLELDDPPDAPPLPGSTRRARDRR